MATPGMSRAAAGLTCGMSRLPGIEVLRCTAFSADPEGGNPAGVVLDASGLADAAMLAAAAEPGYSESAFLTGRGESGGEGAPGGAGASGALAPLAPSRQAPGTAPRTRTTGRGGAATGG